MLDATLSQDNIDTLIRQATTKERGHEHLYSASKPSLKDSHYKSYDFRRPKKLEKDQLGVLQGIAESFARLASSTLTSYLSTSVTIDLISIDQTLYKSYTEDNRSPVFITFTLSPLTGYMVLGMSSHVTFTTIDRLLGGSGEPTSHNVVTDIEKPIVRCFANKILEAFEIACKHITVLNPKIEEVTTNHRAVQAISPKDSVIVLVFQIKVGDVHGIFSLCLPDLSLRPFFLREEARQDFSQRDEIPENNYRQVIANQLTSLPVECSVELGKTKIAIRDFLRLCTGDVILLDKGAECNLHLCINETPKFFGRPALDDKRLVFHITGAFEPSF